MSNNVGPAPIAAESFAMTGGDGTYSYTKNSSFQRTISNAVKGKIDGAINEELDMKNLFSTSKTIRIADFGCAVGPNTFITMWNIVEAVTKKYQAQNPGSQLPEFQMLFNDLVSNDFNALFTTLPLDRNYFAAAVPGSFHGRLLAESSLHFAHSSAALHWLAIVPEEVLDQNSPAWNKGRIYHMNSQDEVVNAYRSEFARGMEIFLNSRAKELVAGGIMLLTIPARPTGVTHSQSPMGLTSALLESSFVDMVNKGLISEAQLDSFNFPPYKPSPEELQEILDRNGCFNIEKMELITLTTPEPSGTRIDTDITGHGHRMMMHIRAATQGMISKHFGTEILDELFDQFRRKVDKLPHHLESVFVVLTKRKRSRSRFPGCHCRHPFTMHPTSFCCSFCCFNPNNKYIRRSKTTCLKLCCCLFSFFFLFLYKNKERR